MLSIAGFAGEILCVFGIGLKSHFFYYLIYFYYYL